MFLVFGGKSYYSSGPYNDFLGSFDNLLDAVFFAKESIGKYALYEEDDIYSFANKIEFIQILNEAGELVFNSRTKPYGADYEKPIIRIINESEYLKLND